MDSPSTSRTLSSRVYAFLMNPYVVLVITVLVRLIVFSYRMKMEGWMALPLSRPSLNDILDLAGTESGSGNGINSGSSNAGGPAFYAQTGEQLTAPHPFRFTMVTPTTDASTWRAVVHWRDHFTEPLPAYLTLTAPWYARFIPSIIAEHPLIACLCLALCDGLTAALVCRWSSCTARLLYAFFVLNPFTVFPSTYGALAPLECAALTLIVDLCQPTSGRHRALRMTFAVVIGLALGSDFFALPIVVLLPVGTPKTTKAVATAICCVGAITGYALLYLFSTEDAFLNAALHAPPDCGAQWYVRQVVLYVFQRCLRLFYMQLPSFVSVLVATCLPRFRRVPGFEPLFADSKVCMMLFAVMFSILLRSEITVPYCLLALLFIYSSLNLSASAQAVLGDGTTVLRNAYVRVRLIVPIYIALLSLPLVMSFYTGWVLWEVANGNWLMFAQVAFVLGGTGFVLMWYNEVVKDALVMEAAWSTTKKKDDPCNREAEGEKEHVKNA